MANLEALIRACEIDGTTLCEDAQLYMNAWIPWLHPISEASPAGEDPAYHEAFQLIREEVNKLSDFDTSAVAMHAEALLTTVSKDIRIITFYLWSRLHQEGERGLVEGLELLAAALQKYGDNLYPQRPRSRQAALAWLSSTRVLDDLSRWPTGDITLTRRACGALIVIHHNLNDDERPGLALLLQTLEVRLAQNGGASSVVPQNSCDHAHAEVASLQSMPAMTGQALMEQAKQLAKYLREQPNGWLAANHLMKSIRWDTIQQLPVLGPAGNTRLRPPKPDHRAQLKRLYLQQNWMELLELTDSLFGQAVNHLWLDLQWYGFEALNRLQQGSPQAKIIQQDLCGLLSRLPGLEALAFEDGTPFADEVTRNWISQAMLDHTSLRGCEAMQPNSTCESEIVELEREALQKADADGIDVALGWLQNRQGATSAREQWFLRLVMARVCEQYGRSEMALHLLNELNQHAREMTLLHWSPELLFEVQARRLKLLRGKAARSENDKIHLQPEMDMLLSGLISIDPARAAVLCN